jgi:sialate O-acetylesterase
MRVLLIVLAHVLLISNAISEEFIFRMAPLFTDNMVIQQQSEVPFWGRGVPGSAVSLRASWGDHASTLVGADGLWMLMLGTPAAGGPYTIEVGHDGAVTTLKNVLAGEVWLCSGQSNMEMPMQGWPPADTVMHSAGEIKNSTIPEIRLYTVQRTFSPAPEFSCAGSWVECSPATTPGFSATAYFFGKALHQALKVPIGLIHTSWGGTPVESWMSAGYLSRVGRFDTTLQKIRETATKMSILQDWLGQFPVIAMSGRPGEARWRGLDFQDGACSNRVFDDSAWGSMRLPVVWEKTELGEFDGSVWFRKHITIPATWLHKDLVMELGPIDDMDITFVNGVKVGGYEGDGFWNVGRIYKIPKVLVDSTEMEIAIRVIDNQGGGGIFGAEGSMVIHPEGVADGISLAGSWKYLPVAVYRGDRFHVCGAEHQRFFTRPRLPMDLSAYSPTTLYNAMIAPLAPFSIRGAIWYQGESNTNEPELYRRLFPLMIKNWRSTFHSGDFPFYFVQLAPYAYGAQTQSQYLREAQLMTLSLQNTGMAVTLDIGNPANIHPANKSDVGKRLALWALADTYGKKIPFSGPIYRASRQENHRIVLSFDYAAKGLVLRERADGNGFQISGPDRVFRDAMVTVRGNTVAVWHPAVKEPKAVRYAFTNTSQATLFNREGLPSPSFRTDTWVQLEAEAGRIEGLPPVADSVAAGGAFVRMVDNSSVTWQVDLADSGWYDLFFRYRSPGGEKEQLLVRNERVSPIGFGIAERWHELKTRTFLRNGVNTVGLRNGPGTMDLDGLAIVPAAVVPVITPHGNIFYRESPADITIKLSRFGHRLRGIEWKGKPLLFVESPFEEEEDAAMVTLSKHELLRLPVGEHRLTLRWDRGTPTEFRLSVFRSRKAAGLTIIAPDVEHGTSVLFILPTGKTFLVDCGKDWVRDQTIIPFLHRNGIQKLDYFLITHYDGDHDGGDRGEAIRKIFSVGSFFDYRSFRTGDTVNLEGVRLRILNSYEDGTDENSRSLSFRLAYKGFIYVHGADTYADNQVKILERFPHEAKADVFHANHHFHGSVDVRYLRAVDPAVILLQAEKAIYARSAYMVNVMAEFIGSRKEARKRPAEILPALEVGTTVVRVEGNGKWTCETYRDTPACIIPYLFQESDRVIIEQLQSGDTSFSSAANPATFVSRAYSWRFVDVPDCGKLELRGVIEPNLALS